MENKIDLHPSVKLHPSIEIIHLKKMLDSTDYKAIKYAEGILTEEEYAPIKAERQALRDEINRLELELNNMQ